MESESPRPPRPREIKSNNPLKKASFCRCVCSNHFKPSSVPFHCHINCPDIIDHYKIFLCVWQGGKEIYYTTNKDEETRYMWMHVKLSSLRNYTTWSVPLVLNGLTKQNNTFHAHRCGHANYSGPWSTHCCVLQNKFTKYQVFRASPDLTLTWLCTSAW